MKVKHKKNYHKLEGIASTHQNFVQVNFIPSMWLVLQYFNSNLHWSISELLSFMMLKTTLNYNFKLKYYQVKIIKQIFYLYKLYI
jgi:hypothetical protein